MDRNFFWQIETQATNTLRLLDHIDAIEYELEQAKIIAAKYQAFFFGKSDLAHRLQCQQDENRDNHVGEFDGFCYSSARARAVFRTLEDMEKCGMISEEEYNSLEAGRIFV